MSSISATMTLSAPAQLRVSCGGVAIGVTSE
jgi:hypothetical protein